jgi:hypothetical protein
MSTPRVQHTAPDHGVRRARTTGLAIAGIGVLILNIAPFLNWVSLEGEMGSRTGYETDSLIPFIAYLGIGFVAALVYASKRARRGQHRGLTLASLAVAIAATIHTIAFAMNPMGGLERGDAIAADLGVFVGLLGAAVWAVGSALLAKEIEGDDDERTDSYTRDAGRAEARVDQAADLV